MRGLSISTAWDEAKAILVRDGKLLASVALALVALPTAVTGLLNPNGVTDSNAAIWSDIVIIVASLIALSGQLALIRLALGPSITVGGAIAHGIRRVPVYFLAVLIIVVALLVVAVPFALVLSAMGVPLGTASTSMPASPAIILITVLYLALACFVGVRMVMAAPAASAEPIGSIAVLERSWRLTAGHWWKLFGFLVAFFVGAVVLLLALGATLGVVVTMAMGPVAPMSASALVVALVQALANAVISTLFAVMLARIYAQLAGFDAQASVPSSGI
jgi:hypothetical protein